MAARIGAERGKKRTSGLARSTPVVEPAHSAAARVGRPTGREGVGGRVRGGAFGAILRGFNAVFRCFWVFLWCFWVFLRCFSVFLVFLRACNGLFLVFWWYFDVF
jgi:hypothetical protein